ACGRGWRAKASRERALCCSTPLPPRIRSGPSPRFAGRGDQIATACQMRVSGRNDKVSPHRRAILPRRFPGEFMRVAVCAVVLTMGLALRPAVAEPDRAGTAFWKSVQATCNATAAKPAGELGQRIAKAAIAEFNQFGGHQIDANGHLFHFGLTEAEHE